jgi:hypothetical protein
MENPMLARPLRSAASIPRLLLGPVLGLFLLAVAAPASAEKIEREFPFELDEWFAIDHQEGDVTIRRIRVETKANVKSRIMRPGAKADPMVQDVQIQVEYTNDADRDIECELEIFWLDAEGRRIDGYDGKEDMEEDETGEMTALRSTLAYGLEVAKKLSVKIVY